jgi:hypothetical protein
MPDKSFPDLDAYGELSHKKKNKSFIMEYLVEI